MATKPVIHQIQEAAVKILENYPNGIRRKDFLSELESLGPDWHPKTINGCVWLLHEKFPDSVYKPERWVWKHAKFR